MTRPDLILVGGGLAGGLLAMRLLQSRPDVSFLVVEAGPDVGGNHTWSFHDGDLSAEGHALVAPLVGHHWPGQQVVFPGFRRELPAGYNSIASTRFRAVLTERLGSRLVLNAPVRGMEAARVHLEDGRTLEAGAVVDAVGFRDSAALAIRFQSFLGLELRLERPHGVTTPIIMDATTVQDDGYRFTYVLPLAPDRLLIEDTGYVDGRDLDRAALDRRILAYCADRGWRIAERLRSEHGVLPITLGGDIDRFWRETPVPRIGVGGNFFHPTTGYSLPDAVRVADLVAGLSGFEPAPLRAALVGHSRRLWRDHRFYRLLNRMLFLAARPDERWTVMRRFYRLPAPLIERFYAGRLTRTDKARILFGRPPVPLGRAIRAAFSPPSRTSI